MQCDKVDCFLIQSKHGVEGEKLDYLTLRLQTVETENVFCYRVSMVLKGRS